MKYFRAFILINAAFLSSLTLFSQQTYYVTNSTDTGEGSLREILLLIDNGDTVKFESEVDTVNLTSGELIIGKSVSIIGHQENTVLKRAAGSPDFRIINIYSDDTLEIHLKNLVITNGKAIDGIEGNIKGQNGGGIFIGQNNHRVYLENCEVNGNHAGNGYHSYTLAGDGGDGGGISTESFISLVYCSISANKSGEGYEYQIEYYTKVYGTDGGNGGGIYATGVIDLNSCTISDNLASRGANADGQSHYDPTADAGDGGSGGGLYCLNGAVHIADCNFTGNSSGEGGNGSAPWGGTAGNAGDGGATYFKECDVIIVNSIFLSNVTGIGGDASAGIQESTICGYGGDGGAVFFSMGNIEILNSELKNNFCGRAGYNNENCWRGADGGSGGGAYLKADTIIISGTLFEHNSAGNGGRCTGLFSGKKEYNGGSGGGLMIDSVMNCLSISSSQFIENSTGDGGDKYSLDYRHGLNGGNGGGICLKYTVYPAYITNSLIAGNTTGKSYLFDDIDYYYEDRPKAGDGGGIFVGNGPVKLINVTCAGNNTKLSNIEGVPISVNDTMFERVLGKGGGAYFKGADAFIINSIISDNTIADTLLNNDIADSAYVNYSLVKDSSRCVIIGDHNIFNLDPAFRNFPDSLMLTNYSPAVNAGNPDTNSLDLPGTDLAGNPRIFNDTIDMGAYELQEEVMYYLKDQEPTPELSVFPNPADQLISIVLSKSLSTDALIQILNLQGQQVYQSEIGDAGGNTSIKISVRDLPGGIYFLRVLSKEGSAGAKIIVIH